MEDTKDSVQPIIPVAATKPATKYKKDPNAPKRFKSAFILFSSERHKTIKEELEDAANTKTTAVAKMVSEEWRNMPAEDKAKWEEKAAKDKQRYEMEKAMYRGPWKIQARKRTPKDPSAPKRPMSAFLAYSNERRAGLKRENPSLTNSDLSKMLSKAWAEEKEDVKKKYKDDEAKLREKYKVDVAEWRKKMAEEKLQERQEREAVAMQAAEARAKDPNAIIPGVPFMNPGYHPHMMNPHMMPPMGVFPPHMKMNNPAYLQMAMAQQQMRRGMPMGSPGYPPHMMGQQGEGAPAEKEKADEGDDNE